MTDTNDIESAVLTVPQAAKYIGVSVFTLRRMRSDGKGPKVLQISDRRIGYRKATLDAWLTERETGEVASS